ncbi:HAD-IC family P-type ATPase [Paenarthrobacter sp. DKR-5]|uniref:HAD-IC family P-type ATPase n=1 Tax=Paenarthrobacter sp. DKR-5 TaxID=2835535 RepID=UPI001BDDB015|nr:HAD-IC family P-type ATPase [Paenarthrobacter sp. DKR-5]MBT1004392.1 HAD-IC family P-type ATPase [Paenarthrobacter sp. DKR-5]
MTPAGLSSAEAALALSEIGPNEVPAARVPAAARVAGKLWAPIPWMLELTAALELLLGKYPDALIILSVLGLNTVLGLVQENRAEAVLEMLRSRLRIDARVLRDGAWTTVPSVHLVPGDVLHLRVGDFAPADVHVENGFMLIDQSSLTGESAPVERGPGGVVYSGSVVARGEATGTVTGTGVNTFFGRTVQLVGEAAPQAHLERVVLRMVRVFIVADVLLAAAGTVRLVLAGAAPGEIAAFAVVLLLASVPVALPAAFAVAAALGARHLAGVGILTSRPAVLQEASTMDVLCVDKTGTLTGNVLSVEHVMAAPGMTAAQVLQWAAAASDDATQDPIDLAILSAARTGARLPATREKFVPFDPATKRSEAFLRTRAGLAGAAKGAPAAIAVLTGAADPDPRVGQLATEGSRVLAVAAMEPGGHWKEAGLLALTDRPRADAAELLRLIQGLGVRTIMVTGDTAATAGAIAAQIGLTGRTVTAGATNSDDWTASDIAVIAQVLPEHKYQLIKQLQAAGHVVGMTGDGVNDAPALRQADVGVAVEGATDVAKSAAGVVLTRSGLTGIIELVRESRRIHQRSLTYALNVSVKKIEVPLLLTFGVFAWREFLFTPLLMALLLLGNDVISMAIATDRAEPAPSPDRWDVGRLISGAFAVALPLLAVSIGILWTARDVWPRFGLDQLRTLSFLILVLSSQLTIYLVRTGGRCWAGRPARWLLTASAADVAGAFILAGTGTLMTAVGLHVVATAAAVITSGAVAADLVKVPVFRTLGLHGAVG